MPSPSHRKRVIQELLFLTILFRIIERRRPDLTPEVPNSQTLLVFLERVLSRRYLHTRNPVPKAAAGIDLCLNVYRDSARPELAGHFRTFARMFPTTFNKLVTIIAPSPIFANRSLNQEQQISVERQLLVTLYRFGSFGNSASIRQVALWAGIGEGTVVLCTKRVLYAILSSGLREQCISWPGVEERNAYKERVEEIAIPEWRNGWVMIDGTLIPLYTKPSYYGESFFDRKSNYSLNIQIVNTPDRRIIDYALGFVGSCSDSYCWKETRLYKEHSTLLGEGCWAWGDAGYPIQEWLVIPYKRPEKDVAENRTFNYQLSRIRVASEHTIGLLKGRFQSLRGLRATIHNVSDLQFVHLWFHGCITLHSFCFMEEHGLDNRDFLREGLAAEGELAIQDEGGVGDDLEGSRSIALTHAKDFRERLKDKLYLYYGVY